MRISGPPARQGTHIPRRDRKRETCPPCWKRMKTGCGGGRCQQGGPAPHGGEHGGAGSPAQQNRPGVRRRAGALLTADLTAAADEGAVIYRRRKQRMPSAIRARKAQHGAAPTQSPAPEAQASMRMSTAGRASTAEPGIRQGWRPLCPQHARQIGRQAAQTGGSGGRKKERRGGCGCGRGPVPGAQQGEHQSAQRRGTRKQAGRAQRQRFVGPAFLSRRADPPGGAATPQSSLCAGCGDCTSKCIYS